MSNEIREKLEKEFMVAEAFFIFHENESDKALKEENAEIYKLHLKEKIRWEDDIQRLNQILKGD